MQQVVDDKFVLHLRKNELYTLTTLPDGIKGDYGPIPPSAPFPLPYKETFEGDVSDILCNSSNCLVVY